MSGRPVEPVGWARPRGYSNGMAGGGGVPGGGGRGGGGKQVGGGGRGGGPLARGPAQTLAAAGAFCAGGDVNEIIGRLVEYDAGRLLEFTRMTGELVANIRKLRKPVVAAINGVAAGAGAVIALACDLRVMADSAKIAFLFVRVGLAGADMGAAWLLPQVVGLGRASEILMLGDAVTAPLALEMGLVNRVATDAA